MKLLVGGIIALLCVQAIHSSEWSKCEKNLISRKKDIGYFMEDFEKQDIEVKNQFQAMKDACDAVNHKFKKLTDEGCVQNPHAAECQIDEFLDNFFELRIKVVKHLTKLIHKAAVELNMAHSFKCENKFVCIFDKTATGCEKETNALNCNVVKFAFYINSEFAHGTNSNIDILNLVDKMDEVARQFSSEYSPICNDGQCSCRDDKNNESLRTAFKEFHTVFGSLLEQVGEKLSDMIQVGNNIKEEIDDWKKTRVSTE